jgi:hypothetical protein
LIAKRLVDQSNLPRTIALAIPEGKPMKYIVFAAAMAASPAFADQPATLQSLGLSAADADALLTQAKVAEAALGPDTIALLDSFDGTLIVGRDGH